MHPTDLSFKSVPLSLSPMAQQKRLRDSLRRERWAKYVTDEALDEMLEQATVRSYPRKSFVLRHRDRGHNFFGLLSGEQAKKIMATVTMAQDKAFARIRPDCGLLQHLI